MTSKIRVLVVDDERPIRRFLNASLRGEYLVLEAATGEEALAVTISSRPEVIILDLGLPDMDGVDLISRLREWTHIPIIVISIRAREEDKVATLDAGADDYLGKPFGIGELMARLRVVLRRNTILENEPIYRTDHFTVDLSKHTVIVDGKTVSLTPTEYDILRILIQHAGKVLTHKQLSSLVWGDTYQVDAHLLRVNVSNLRRKIEVNPSRPLFITTEPGVGYRLKDQDSTR